MNRKLSGEIQQDSKEPADLKKENTIKIGPDFQANLPTFNEKLVETISLPMDRETRVSSTAEETQVCLLRSVPLLLWDPTKMKHETWDRYNRLFTKMINDQVAN